MGVDCTHAACCSAKGGWEGAELGAMVVLAYAERDQAKLRRGTGKVHADCTLWILFLRPGFTRVANLLTVLVPHMDT